MGNLVKTILRNCVYFFAAIFFSVVIWYICNSMIIPIDFKKFVILELVMIISFQFYSLQIYRLLIFLRRKWDKNNSKK